MTTDHPLGTVLRDGDTVGLRFERHLAHSPQRVWQALTESDQLRHWFPVDLVGERRAGASLTLPFWPEVVDAYEIDTPPFTGQILTWDPPRTFSWMWDRDTLTFELHPTAEGTRLVFTTWVVDTSAGVDKTATGYHVCLDQLATLVATGTAPPFTEPDRGRYEAIYANLVTT